MGDDARRSAGARSECPARQCRDTDAGDDLVTTVLCEIIEPGWIADAGHDDQQEGGAAIEPGIAEGTALPSVDSNPGRDHGCGSLSDREACQQLGCDIAREHPGKSSRYAEQALGE